MLTKSSADNLLKRIINLASRMIGSRPWTLRGKLENASSEGRGIRRNHSSSDSGLRYYCNKLGHIRAHCMKRKRDMRVLVNSGNGSSRSPTVNK